MLFHVDKDPVQISMDAVKAGSYYAPKTPKALVPGLVLMCCSVPTLASSQTDYLAKDHGTGPNERSVSEAVAAKVDVSFGLLECFMHERS